MNKNAEFSVWTSSPQESFRTLKANRKSLQRHTLGFRKVMKRMGITEVIFGCLCIIFGIVITPLDTAGFEGTMYSDDSGLQHSYHRLKFGEGIWFGSTVVVGGGMSLAIGYKVLTRSLIVSQILINILAALCSLVAALLCTISIQLLKNAICGVVVLYIILNILAYVCFLLAGSSALYCWVAIKALKKKSNKKSTIPYKMPYQDQIVHVRNNNQQQLYNQKGTDYTLHEGEQPPAKFMVRRSAYFSQSDA